MAGFNQEDLLAQLKLLADKFGERLRSELPALADTARALRALSEADQADTGHALLHGAYSVLHKLAGSSASFGFTELGKSARQLELRANVLLAENLQKTLLTLFCIDLIDFTTQQLTHLEQPLPTSAPTLVTSEQVLCNALIDILDADLVRAHHLGQALISFGYDVRYFQSLATLTYAWRHNTADALIVSTLSSADVATPVSDIVTLQQTLVAPIPLLLISQDSGFNAYLQAVRAGAFGFFTHPVNISELENRLERCLNMRHVEPYRVLIIDDDTELSSHYCLVLKSAGFWVESEQDPSRALAVLQRFRPEVLLLDVHMPTCSGPELAQIIRLHEEWLRLPIIYLSAETDITLQLSALLKAGDDFLTKPIADNALIASVFARSQRARMLANALSCDSLTGLLQHKDIKSRIGLELARAQRSGQVASVVMIDIDHFKRVNDNYGHSAGDNVIRALANLLRQRLRKTDSLGRYGGEEFALVLADCPADKAKIILDELLKHFSALTFYADGQAFHVSFSAGIAASYADTNLSDMLEAADKAMYLAKQAGRNQVRIYV